MTPATCLLLAPLFALIAAAYAAVGLGGGTAYLSVLAFWDANPATLRPIAWTLNCIVAAVGFYNYSRRRHFSAAATWPYLAGGVAGSAAGAVLPIGVEVFQTVLALTLAGVSIRMLAAKNEDVDAPEPRRPSRPWALVLGAAIGLLSGLVGIGGGIILGPVAISLGWLDMKQSAPVTSLYVFVCSAGALAAHLLRGGTLHPVGGPLLGVAVLVGGFTGSWWGAVKASPRTLQRLFGLVALAAATKLALDLAGLTPHR